MGPVWEKHRRTQPERRGRNWPVHVLIRGAKGHHRWRWVELGTPWPSAPFCYLLLKTWAWLHWIQEIFNEHLLWYNWASFRIPKRGWNIPGTWDDLCLVTGLNGMACLMKAQSHTPGREFCLAPSWLVKVPGYQCLTWNFSPSSLLSTFL